MDFIQSETSMARIQAVDYARHLAKHALIHKDAHYALQMQYLTEQQENANTIAHIQM